MPIGVRTPVVSMSMRALIGIVHALVTPAIRSFASISAVSSSHEIRSGQIGRTRPLSASGSQREYQRSFARHSPGGFEDHRRLHHRERRGSVLVSARPALPYTRSTSGNDLSTRSCFCSSRLPRRPTARAASWACRGSCLRGRRHELLPQREVPGIASATTVAAASTILPGCLQHEPARRIVDPEDRAADRVLLLGVVRADERVRRELRERGRLERERFMRVNSMRIAGSSVIASTAASAMAMFFEYASGLNSRPFRSTSAKIGRKRHADARRAARRTPPARLP